MLPAEIRTKIVSLRRLLRRLIFAAGISRVTLIAIGLISLCFLSDFVFNLPPVWRIVLGAGSLAGLAAAIYAFIAQPLLVPMADDQVALLFERRFPELSDLLVSAIQLSKESAGASGEMVGAVVADAQNAAANLEPMAVPKLGKLRLFSIFAAGAVIVAVAVAATNPQFTKIFLARYLAPLGPVKWPQSTELLLEVAGSRAGEVAVPRGEQVQVSVTAINARRSPVWKAPDKVWLDCIYGSGEKRSISMRRDDANEYLSFFNDTFEDITVSARAGSVKTDAIRIHIVELPRVEDVRVTCEYPAYLGIPPEQRSRSDSEIAAVEGTRIIIDIKSSVELSSGGAAIRIHPAGGVDMQEIARANHFTHRGEFILERGMQYARIELTDGAGLRNKPPRVFQLTVIEDRAPEVKIVKPGGAIRCTPYAIVPLDITAKDDYALSRAWLRFALGPQDAPKAIPFDTIAPNTKDIAVSYRWDLAEFGLQVGQTISYRAESSDFRTVVVDGKRAEQTGRSDEFYISIVSATDLASELDARLMNLRAELKKTRARQADDRLKIEELLRKISEGQPLTNEDRSIAADTENLQNEIARSTTRLADELAAVREAMQNNRVGSFADRQRLEGSEDALRSLVAREMPNAADFIKDARRDLASREGMNSLQSAGAIQNNIIDEFDKIISSLESNEDIENLIRTAREILKKQSSTKEETTKFASRPDTFGLRPAELKTGDLASLNLLVRNQKSTRDDTRNLEQDMLTVLARLKNDDPRRGALVEKALAQAAQNQIRPNMDEAANNLAANQTGRAAAGQEQAIKGLERLLETLEQAKQESGGDEELEGALSDVRSALEKVRELRKRQEGHVGDLSEVNKEQAHAANLRALKSEVARERAEQKSIKEQMPNAPAEQSSAREQSLEKETAKTASKIKTESEAAAERKAASAPDTKEAADSAEQAAGEMGNAKEAVKSDKPQAERAAADAEQKLAESEQSLERAIEKSEQSRAEKLREAAIKQGETRKETADAAKLLDKLAKENEKSMAEAAESMGKAGQQVESAGGNMQDSQSRLDENDVPAGESEAKDALEKLKEAEEMLKKSRDELEKRQREQQLIELIGELQPMLDAHIKVLDETRRIDDEMITQKLTEPSRPDKVRLTQLSADEAVVAEKSAALLEQVEAADAPVFIWGLTKLTKDLLESKDLLAEFKPDEYTQAVQKDAADTLRMLIDALKQEQSKMRESGGGGEGGQPRSGGKPMLVPPSAQLKLLRARQLEIYNATKKMELRRQLADGRFTPLEQKRLSRLATEQAELSDLTQKLADALERELQNREEPQ